MTNFPFTPAPVDVMFWEWNVAAPALQQTAYSHLPQSHLIIYAPFDLRVNGIHIICLFCWTAPRLPICETCSHANANHLTIVIHLLLYKFRRVENKKWNTEESIRQRSHHLTTSHYAELLVLYIIQISISCFTSVLLFGYPSKCL